MALVQTITSIVPELVHQSHILQQFFLALIRHSTRRQSTLEHFMGKLDRLCILSSLGVQLLELIYDLI